MPDVDGRDVCRELRRRSQVPIVMLTARGTETDRIVGLELGADDYVVKPFSSAEVIARIRAILRRTANSHEAPASGRLGARDVEVGLASRRAWRAGEELILSRKDSTCSPCSCAAAVRISNESANTACTLATELLICKHTPLAHKEHPTMATSTTSRAFIPEFEVATERARDANRRFAEVGRKVTTAYLDGVENYVAGVAQFERKIGLLNTHAQLTEDVVKASISAARELIAA